MLRTNMLSLLFLFLASSASANCLTARQMLDRTPFELVNSKACDFITWRFMKFNEIPTDQLLSTRHSTDPDDLYYVWIRNFEASIAAGQSDGGRFDKASWYLVTLMLLPEEDQIKRLSYEAYVAREFIRLRDDSETFDSTELLFEIFQSKGREAGFATGAELVCFIKSDVPGVPSDEIIETVFYKDCIGRS